MVSNAKALTRLKEEETNLKLYASKLPKGCTIKPKMKGMAKDYFIWQLSIEGRAGTPWEGGIYTGMLKFGNDYPDIAPLFTFDLIDGESIQHPNIYKNGDVCIDILKAKYTPDKSLLDIVIALENLLYAPNKASPANPMLLLKSKESYEKTIREQALKTKKK